MDGRVSELRSPQKYGTQVFMNSGRIYCDAKGCREKLEAEINA